MYPVNLDISNQNVLVVGGGKIAARKLRRLIDENAVITIVSPALHPKTRSLVQSVENKIRWYERPFQDTDITSRYLLVFALTDDPDLQDRIEHLCRKENILLNRLDKQVPGGFILPAVYSDNDIVVAVSTSGKFPLLAKTLRDLLGEKLQGLGNLATPLFTERNKILQGDLSPEEKGRALEKLVEGLIKKLDW